MQLYQFALVIIEKLSFYSRGPELELNVFKYMSLMFGMEICLKAYRHDSFKIIVQLINTISGIKYLNLV